MDAKTGRDPGWRGSAVVRSQKITPAASELITREKRAGKSSREVARLCQEQLGISIDQRTISIHAARIAGKARDRTGEPGRSEPIREIREPEAPKPPAKTKKKPERDPAPPRAMPEPRFESGEGAVEPTLDEIEALEREARRLQRLLQIDLTAKDRAALNSELRQTFGAIRKAQGARQEAAKLENADTAWVLAKLKRFDRMNTGATEEDEGADGLSEAARAATGG